MKKRLLMILPLLLGAMMTVAETNLIITSAETGTDLPYALSSIGKISFAENGSFGQTIYLYNPSGDEIAHRNLSSIAKIYFKEGTIDAVEDVNTSVVRVYPNPTAETIHISGLQAGQTVRIYTLQGQMLTDLNVKSEETEVDVRALPNDSYLLQIGSEVFKLIKQ
jgi:hypothetical protein